MTMSASTRASSIRAPLCAQLHRLRTTACHAVGTAAGLYARRFSSAPGAAGKPRVLIVGSGPAGMYCAQSLLRSTIGDDIQIDISDSLPAPYGLVRYGVAPDHPDTKNCEHKFNALLHDKRVNFVGHASLGKDFDMCTAHDLYSAVILSYGASSDRKLMVSGEGLLNSIPARIYVNWYNGHPLYQYLKPNLSGKEAVLIGNGNVSLDIARLLLRPATDLASTDITATAEAAISSANVKDISIVARRGPVQAAFTIKELREVTKLPGVRVRLAQPLNLTDGDKEEIQKQGRIRKRQIELLSKIEDGSAGGDPNGDRTLWLHFYKSPFRFDPHDDNVRVASTTFKENVMRQGSDGEWSSVNAGTAPVSLPSPLVLRSVGYKTVPVGGIPMHPQKSVIASNESRVDGHPGVYCSGWCKRGPSGDIGSNVLDAELTVQSIVYDWQAGILHPVAEGVPSLSDVLYAKGVQVMDKHAWFRLDEHEQQMGKAEGRPRVKVTSMDSMLQFSN